MDNKTSWLLGTSFAILFSSGFLLGWFTAHPKFNEKDTFYAGWKYGALSGLHQADSIWRENINQQFGKGIPTTIWNDCKDYIVDDVDQAWGRYKK